MNDFFDGENSLIEITVCSEFSGQRLDVFCFKAMSEYILSRNYYGWFKKISKGIYGVSEKGYQLLESGEYEEAIKYYREKAKEVLKATSQ